jgi:hypothetical protein
MRTEGDGVADWKMRIRRGMRVRAGRWLGLNEPEIAVDPILESDLAFLRQHFDRPKFFVLGYPRSGTTLLARLLRLHPDVHTNWQANIAGGHGDLLAQLASPGLADWLSRPSNRWTRRAPALAPLIRAVSDVVLERGAHEADAHWVGDKTPTARMDRAVDRLARIYPDAWLIAIVRDGRDAALSQRFQAFIDQPDTLSVGDLRLRDALRATPAAFGAEGRSIFSAAWLDRVAADWQATVVAGDDRARTAYGERYLSVPYEGLLAAPWETICRLWTSIGIEDIDGDLAAMVEAEMTSNPAASWHAEAAPALVEGVERGVVGGWRRWLTPTDRERFERSAEEGLRRWGYLEAA